MLSTAPAERRRRAPMRMRSPIGCAIILAGRAAGPVEETHRGRAVDQN
jgi:hypothetical protein